MYNEHDSLTSGHKITVAGFTYNQSMTELVSFPCTLRLLMRLLDNLNWILEKPNFLQWAEALW